MNIWILGRASQWCKSTNLCLRPALSGAPRLRAHALILLHWKMKSKFLFAIWRTMKAPSCTAFLKDEDECLRSFKKMQFSGKANQSNAWKDRLMTFSGGKKRNSILWQQVWKSESQTAAADSPKNGTRWKLLPLARYTYWDFTHKMSYFRPNQGKKRFKAQWKNL